MPLLKIITSENVAFEAHSKIFFLIISWKSHALFFRYSIFYIPTALKDVMSLRVLTHDVYHRIEEFLNHKSFGHKTRLASRYRHRQIFKKNIGRFGGVGPK